MQKIYKKALSSLQYYYNSGTCRLYVLLVACFTIQMLIFHWQAFETTVLTITPAYVIRSLVDACIVMLPVLLLPVRARRWWWVVIAMFSGWFLCQMWYVRTYHDLMGLSSFLMFDNVNSLLISSTIASMRVPDLLFFAIPILGYVYYRRFIKDKLKQDRMNYIVSALFPALFVLLFLSLFFYMECKAEMHSRVIINFTGRFTEPTTSNQLLYVEHNGLVPSVVYSAFGFSQEVQPLSRTDLKKINAFMESGAVATRPEPQAVAGSKNLIMIIVESLNSWVIDFKINGKEVCPNLNAYCRADSAVVALKMVPQVAAGRSSDAHFMYNTGLLPVFSGATAMLRGNADYPSLAKAMQGYKHLTFSCEDGKLWNQAVTTKSYGYEKYYNEFLLRHITGQEKIIDAELFSGALRVIDSIHAPFMAQIITIAMHQPFNLVERKTWISKSGKYDETVLNYLECVNYFDEILGNFVNGLKRMGKYDNSLIVIASDHNELDKNALTGRAVAKIDDKDCVFLALNAGFSFNQQKVMGQIDVYPTILDLMGLNGYWWKGMGQSVLGSSVLESAVTPDGKVVGNARATQVKRQKRAWSISNTMVMKGYFDSKYNKYRGTRH